MVEVRQYHQYVIRVDGTGRVTIRNLHHLKKFTPFHNPVIPGSLVTPTVAPDDAVTGNPPPSAQPHMSSPAPQSPMPGNPTGVDLNKPSSPVYPVGTPTTTKAEDRTSPIGRLSTPGTRMGTTVITRVPHDQVETVTKDTTQKDIRQTVLEPKRLDFDQSEPHGPTPDKPATSMPRALARLQPHNKPGKKELLMPRRPCHRDNTK